MQLICLSISHHNTPVELRECISLAQETTAEAFARHPVRKLPFETITELAVLSTCNRLEIYALISFPTGEQEDQANVFRPVLEYLQEALAMPVARVEAYFRTFTGGQAARHLFQVASGLDSIAIGENQILGQVARTLDTALQSNSARHVLSSLFRAAIHTGKRVRTETEIGRHPTSISMIGVQLAESSLGSLVDQNILVIGAGKMGGLTVEALQALGARHITLTNRTYSHAAELAQRAGGRVLEYDHLYNGLSESDLIFTSSAAPLPIICYEPVQHMMENRQNRPLTIIDLAVPRNTEPRVSEIPNVFVFNMDDFQAFAKSDLISSHPQIAQAQAIVDQEVAQYEKLLQIIPFIGELHRKVEDIRQREVEKALRHLHDPDPEIVEQMELLSRSLVRKVLHEPTMHLRTETNQQTLNEYVENLARLFDLTENVPDFLRKDSAQKDSVWKEE